MEQLHRPGRRAAWSSVELSCHRLGKPPRRCGCDNSEYWTLDRKEDRECQALEDPGLLVINPGVGGRQGGNGVHGPRLARGPSRDFRFPPAPRAARRSSTPTATRVATTASHSRGGSDVDKLTGPALAKLSESERFGVVSNGVGGGAGRRAARVGVSRNARLDSRTRGAGWSGAGCSRRCGKIERTVISDAARPAFARFVRELCGPDGAAPRLARRGETQIRRRTPFARGDYRDRRSRRRPGHAGEAALAARDAWLARRRRDDADLARSRCRSPPSAATRRCSIGWWRWSARPPGVARDGAGWAGRRRRLGDDRTDAGAGARRHHQDAGPALPVPSIGLRPAARDVVPSWIERHFDELARLFPSFIAGASCASCPCSATPAACAPPRHSCSRAPPSWKGREEPAPVGRGRPALRRARRRRAGRRRAMACASAMIVARAWSIDRVCS